MTIRGYLYIRVVLCSRVRESLWTDVSHPFHDDSHRKDGNHLIRVMFKRGIFNGRSQDSCCSQRDK